MASLCFPCPPVGVLVPFASRFLFRAEIQKGRTALQGTLALETKTTGRRQVPTPVSRVGHQKCTHGPRGAEQRGGGGAAADQMAPEAASGGYPGVLTLRSQYTRFCPHSCSCLEPHPHMSKHSYSLLTQPGPTAGLDSSPLGALALALRSGKDRIPKGTPHSWLSFQGLERATRARQRKGAID